LAAPTLTDFALSLLLGLGGLGGAIYAVVVAARIWKMNLDLSDRAFYALLPILSYAAIATSALLQSLAVGDALEILAVSLVALLITGMRNAWDMASFMIMRQREGE
jgi:hypothetical protein